MATITQVNVPTGTWTVGPKHSSVEFRVKHLGIATVRGYFEEFEGTLEVGDNITAAKAYGGVKTASTNTNEPRVLPRRARLRGHGEPRQRGVRRRRRLSPPSGFQHLARTGM